MAVKSVHHRPRADGPRPGGARGRAGPGCWARSRRRSPATGRRSPGSMRRDTRYASDAHDGDHVGEAPVSEAAPAADPAKPHRPGLRRPQTRHSQGIGVGEATAVGAENRPAGLTKHPRSPLGRSVRDHRLGRMLLIVATKPVKPTDFADSRVGGIVDTVAGRHVTSRGFGVTDAEPSSRRRVIRDPRRRTSG